MKSLTMLQLSEVKVCYACKETKPVSMFYRSNTRYYQRECKACNKKRKQAWHKTELGKLSSANTKLKARFGVTLEQYKTLLVKQNHACLICGVKDTELEHRLAIDHCHTTGKIRGLLCKQCNLGLGNFRDNQVYLRQAITYLMETSNGGID